ncbi:hypothetical protein I8748_19555 [Nostoc sp. CENA67]|uniref:Uncharacterized protein n=1 Tax=Amazonocrinis nigriterrae CENA67 TaxID=2794033 RepID=A0A8J7L9Q0_9NOST|nr:hypothetical protein [Amazonocrinis nigriterrae]MBH8564355.1 hypothetical protein [Amazonocrinis nigriterrae CENA67]
MINPFTQKPEPYPFQGGEASDYEVFVGKAGTWCTRHRISGKTIQSVQPANLDMFNIANLGINILNLGVGIYNGVQLHKIKNKLDRNHEQIQSSFNSIQNALIVQHRTLELLACNQYNLAQQMNIFREEMRTGFQSIVEEVKDVEARRRREEFETRTFKLLKTYERFSYILPEFLEADQLIERAEDLEAWLRTQLNRIDIGKPERLPLLVALSLSVRAKADAFEAKGGEYNSFANKDIGLLINQLRDEAKEFCEERSLYTLGVEMPEILYQYALLNRSLRKGNNLKTQVDSEVIFSAEEVTWDDGMHELRELFKPNIEHIEVLNGNLDIKLNTLADYDWYVRFEGENRLTFNVHSRPSIKLSAILNKIGHREPEKGVIGKTALNTLMLFALPEKINTISHIIQTEFDLETSPKLLGCRNE